MGRFEYIGEHYCDPYKGIYCGIIAIAVIVVSSIGIAESQAEINVWVNQGLCQKPTTSMQYDSALWSGETDYYTYAESCSSNPVQAEVVANTIPSNLFMPNLKYYPRLYYSDGMEIKSFNITIRGKKLPKVSWSSDETNSRRRLTGRKLLKGGSSGGGGGGSAGHSRSYSAFSIRSSPGYSSTRHGGRMVGAVSEDNGISVNIISQTDLLNERIETVPQTDYKPNLKYFKNDYKQIPSCKKQCKVDLYDSFSLEDINKDASLLIEEPMDTEFTLSVSAVVSFDSHRMASVGKTYPDQGGEPNIYNTGYPKIFVTFSLAEDNPMQGLWITLLVFGILGLVCCAPILFTERYEECCENSCGKLDCESDDDDDDESEKYENLYDHKPSHLWAKSKTATTLTLVNPMTVVNPKEMNRGVIINKHNQDYRTTDVAGNRKGSVTTLILSMNDVNKIRGLDKMPLLIELVLDSNDLKSLFGLANSRSLQKLSVGDNNLNTMKGCESQSLTMLFARSNNLVSLSGINCPRLKELDVSDNDISDTSGLNGFSTPCLVTVNLSGNNLTSLGGLSGCMYLESIDASSNDINDDNSVIAIVQNCKNLKSLNLQDNDLKKSTLARIKEMAGPGVQILSD